MTAAGPSLLSLGLPSAMHWALWQFSRGMVALKQLKGRSDEHAMHVTHADGSEIPDADVEILSWAIRVKTGVETPAPVPDAADVEGPAADGHNQVFDPEDEAFDDVPTYGRAGLAPGTRVRGRTLEEWLEAGMAIVLGSSVESQLDVRIKWEMGKKLRFLDSVAVHKEYY